MLLVFLLLLAAASGLKSLEDVDPALAEPQEEGPWQVDSSATTPVLESRILCIRQLNLLSNLGSIRLNKEYRLSITSLKQIDLLKSAYR